MKNMMIFPNIAIQSINIKIKLPNNEWKLKNNIDHSRFNINCTPNIRSPNLTSFLSKPSHHIKNKDIPIKTYKVVQTGPNNQLEVPIMVWKVKHTMWKFQTLLLEILNIQLSME